MSTFFTVWILVDGVLMTAGPDTTVSRLALNDSGETPDTQDALFDFGDFTAAWSHREASFGEAASFTNVVTELAAGDIVHRVAAITWPGNRISVGFHMAMGFSAADGPGTQRLYGTPAYPDYDADGDDRVVFSLEL